MTTIKHERKKITSIDEDVEDVEKLESWYVLDGNVKWFRKQYGDYLKN